MSSCFTAEIRNTSDSVECFLYNIKPTSLESIQSYSGIIYGKGKCCYLLLSNNTFRKYFHITISIYYSENEIRVLRSICYILRVLSPFKEGLMLILNKLFRKQVKSFHLLLDLDPFIFLCSLHNIKYIKFTSLQDISIKVMLISHIFLPK